MERPPVGMDELIDHWTVLEDEQRLVAGKRGATRLGFALLLKHTRHGQFPRGRSEFPDEVAGHVARQVGVPAAEVGFYEWSGSTIEYHRNQVRAHLGFRVCTVADAEKLAAQVAPAERSPDRVQEELLARCRVEPIEPPASAQVARVVRSALHTAEETWFATIAVRLGEPARTGIFALIAAEAPGVPAHKGTAGDWAEPVYRADRRGRSRVVRMVYEVATVQALREQLRCKEIWLVGADRWRNPDEDLPGDYEARRAERYTELREPLDPAEFVDGLRDELAAALSGLNDALPSLEWVEIAERRVGRSGCRRCRPRRSRGTCAGSRPRSPAAGTRSR